jgi:hypothetical protein
MTSDDKKARPPLDWMSGPRALVVERSNIINRTPPNTWPLFDTWSTWYDKFLRIPQIAELFDQE